MTNEMTIHDIPKRIEQIEESLTALMAVASSLITAAPQEARDTISAWAQELQQSPNPRVDTDQVMRVLKGMGLSV